MIKGHALRYEGKLHAFPKYDVAYRLKGYRVEGGCECGALPPDIWRYFTPTNEPNIWRPMSDREPPLVPSQSAVKRWHREHKAELRKQMEGERESD